MAITEINKLSISCLILCVILLLETSVLGNAFVFYTGLPRYFPFFLLATLGFLISLNFRFKSFNKINE